MARLLGFCGVDDSADALHLAAVSACWEWVEWGVLFDPGQEGRPRFPSMPWVHRLCRIRRAHGGESMHLSGHLCGEHALRAVRGDLSQCVWLSEMGFDRIQLNGTAPPEVASGRAFLELIAAARHLGVEWTIQLTGENGAAWLTVINSTDRATVRDANLSVLLDDSSGRGVEMGAARPPPVALTCGYAGGIGPANVGRILGEVTAAAAGTPAGAAGGHMDGTGGATERVWLDMESSLRVRRTASGSCNCRGGAGAGAGAGAEAGAGTGAGAAARAGACRDTFNPDAALACIAAVSGVLLRRQQYGSASAPPAGEQESAVRGRFEQALRHLRQQATGARL